MFARWFSTFHSLQGMTNVLRKPLKSSYMYPCISRHLNIFSIKYKALERNTLFPLSCILAIEGVRVYRFMTLYLLTYLVIFVLVSTYGRYQRSPCWSVIVSISEPVRMSFYDFICYFNDVMKIQV